MRLIQPNIEIKGDTEEQIMARSGQVVGVRKSRVVWRFGFLEGSDSAKAFGVHSEKFQWVLADVTGKILAVHSGWKLNLPERFMNVIDGKF